MLTGKDVHKAFSTSFPYLQPSWDELPEFTKQEYEHMARELNKIIQERTQNEKASSDDKEKH